MSRIRAACIIAVIIGLIALVVVYIAAEHMTYKRTQQSFDRPTIIKTSLCSLGIHSGYLVANAEEFLCYLNPKDAACKGKANDRYNWEYELNLFLLRNQVNQLDLRESTIINTSLINNRGVLVGKRQLSTMINRFTDEIKQKYGQQVATYYTLFYDIEMRCNAGLFAKSQVNTEIKSIHESIPEFRNYLGVSDSFQIEVGKGRRYACRQLEQRIIYSIDQR